LNDQSVYTLREKLFRPRKQCHAGSGWTMLRCVQHESDHGPIRYDTRQGLHGGDRMIEKIGVYYVEGVGYCTGLAWAEKQAANFGAPPPVFVHWETVDGEDEDDVEVIE